VKNMSETNTNLKVLGGDPNGQDICRIDPNSIRSVEDWEAKLAQIFRVTFRPPLLNPYGNISQRIGSFIQARSTEELLVSQIDQRINNCVLLRDQSNGANMARFLLSAYLFTELVRKPGETIETLTQHLESDIAEMLKSRDARREKKGASDKVLQVSPAETIVGHIVVHGFEFKRSERRSGWGFLPGFAK